MDVAELFVSLESNQPHIVEDAKKKFHELLNSCNPNDTWLVNGIFDYSMQTGSLRTVEILVGVREPHDAHLFNKFCESLRNNYKLQGLTLLGHIVRRQPPWLYKIARHSLFKELLKLLKHETEIMALMSALLVVNVLLPIVAGLMETHLQDLFQVFSHLAAWDTANPNKVTEVHLFHLQMALYSLFLRLYGMYPCNFLSFMRQEYSQNHRRLVFCHTIKPMLDTVKMHPQLITSSREYEKGPAKWRTMEPHDVMVECTKITIGGEATRSRVEDGSHSIKIDFSRSLELKYAARSGSGGLSDVWSPSTLCGMSSPPESAPTSIPHTPIAQIHSVSTSFNQEESPPEAAVEATPETTPIKDMRSLVRVQHSSSNVPRALNAITSSPGQSQPSSPMKKDPSPFRFPSNPETSAFHQPPPDLRRDSLVAQKMQKIVTDRTQLSSDNIEGKTKPRALLQPTSPLRVIHMPRLGNESPADQEDREVETTMTSDNNALNSHPRQCDSVVQDITSTDHEDLEECQQEACTARTGLCMPNSNSMRDFTRQVRSRLRYYSQCHGDTPYTGVSTASSPSEGVSIPVSSVVRRANSCPEMKKTSSSLERHPVEKVDEEPSLVNGQTSDYAEVPSDRKKTSCAASQTDDKLLHPYEHLFLAVFPPVDSRTEEKKDEVPAGIDTGITSPLPLKSFSPSDVELFLSTTSCFAGDPKKNRANVEFEIRCWKEQVLLMSLQLHFEKHRREMHAERNRRLFGKCRNIRSMEEERNALKEQISIVANENELIKNCLQKSVEEATAKAQQLMQEVAYYQNKNTQLQAEYTKEKAQRQYIEELLKLEREKTAAVNKELSGAKASLFTLTADLQHMTNLAGESQGLRATVDSLQRELVVGGEVQERHRQRVNSILRHISHSEQTTVLMEGSRQQISALNQALQAQTASLEAAKAHVVEVETQLAKKDATLAETKRLLQQAKDECHEQLEAVQSKYQTLRAINSCLESKFLELRHRLSSVSPQASSSQPTLPSLPPPPPSSPVPSIQVGTDLPDTSPPPSPVTRSDQNR